MRTKPQAEDRAWEAEATADLCPFCPPGDPRHIELHAGLMVCRVQRRYLSCARCETYWRESRRLCRGLRSIPGLRRIAPERCIRHPKRPAYFADAGTPYCDACIAARRAEAAEARTA